MVDLPSLRFRKFVLVMAKVTRSASVVVGQSPYHREDGKAK